MPFEADLLRFIWINLHLDGKMSVKLLAIQPESPKTWQVKLEIDGNVVAYRFTQEDFQLGGKAAFGISSEPAFRQMFRFNPAILIMAKGCSNPRDQATVMTAR